MPTLNTIQFHFLSDGTIDCWFQYEGGVTTSFDPAQIPEQHKGFLGELLPAALAAKVAAESKAAALVAENEAKDANIQEVLGQMDRMKNYVVQAEARIAELAVYEAMAGGVSPVAPEVEKPAE